MGSSMWSWLGRRVEAEVLEIALKHARKVVEAAAAAEKLFREYASGNAPASEAARAEVFRAESEADDVKREAIRLMSEGLIHPIDREELIRLILTVDDVAAYLKGAARRAGMVGPELIDEGVRALAAEMASRVRAQAEKLYTAVEVIRRDPKKALTLADEVERIEEEVDEVRAQALAKVLEFCDRCERMSACIIAKEIVDSIENASDRCEDSADVIRSIALMRA